MKKVLFLAIALMLVMSGAAFAGITDTDHDLSSGSLGSYANANVDQLCKVCHTPHNAPSTIAPLWNHNITDSAAFTTYSSATMNQATAGISSISLACLSCHDGTLGVEEYTGFASAVNQLNATATTNLGTDLSNDHPISISYDDCANCEMIALGTVQGVTTVALFGTNKDMVECASCHKVHDNTITPFLRSTNARSALCLECHDK